MGLDWMENDVDVNNDNDDEEDEKEDDHAHRDDAKNENLKVIIVDWKSLFHGSSLLLCRTSCR